MRRWSLLTVVAIAALAVSGAAGSAKSVQSRWPIRDLGTLGGPTSEAVAINARGQVVGSADTKHKHDGAFVWHACLWQSGKARDLGTLGGTESAAVALNGHGQIVGWSETKSGDDHAFLWRNGRMLDLGTLPGHRYSEASGINERGQVIGISSARVNKDGRPVDVHAFLWQNGRMRSLGALPGGAQSWPTDINELGRIVGASEIHKRTERGTRAVHAFLWRNGRMTDLGTLQAVPRLPESRAVDINGSGQIVGEASYDSGGNTHLEVPFLWQQGTMNRLATPGGDASSPAAIDDSGQIVGAGQVSTGEFHALLWSNGEMTDLGTLLGKKGNSFAVAINSDGLIIGTSDTRVTRHAVAWEDGRITDLGTLGGSESLAVAVNAKGQIAGTADNGKGRYGFPNRAVLWTLRQS